jgi:hypothetical protein
MENFSLANQRNAEDLQVECASRHFIRIRDLERTNKKGSCPSRILKLHWEQRITDTQESTTSCKSHKEAMGPVDYALRMDKTRHPNVTLR